MALRRCGQKCCAKRVGHAEGSSEAPRRPPLAHLDRRRAQRGGACHVKVSSNAHGSEGPQKTAKTGLLLGCMVATGLLIVPKSEKFLTFLLYFSIIVYILNSA